MQLLSTEIFKYNDLINERNIIFNKVLVFI